MLRKEALPFPKSVLIETSTSCNGRCKFCPYYIFRAGSSSCVMNTQAFKRLIDELSLFSVERISLFCNNEPLLDNRLAELINYTKGKNPLAKINISTNGVLLTASRAIELRNNGLDVLSISIPSLDHKEYAFLMNYRLKDILETINEIMITPASKMVYISIPETYAYDPFQFHAYFSPKGIKVTSWPLEYKKSWNIPLFESLRYAQSRKPEKPCDRPLDQACILADGSVVLCCRDWNGESLIGNIYKNTLLELWTSPQMKNAQQLIVDGRYDDIPVCKDCTQNPQMW